MLFIYLEYDDLFFSSFVKVMIGMLVFFVVVLMCCVLVFFVWVFVRSVVI